MPKRLGENVDATVLALGEKAEHSGIASLSPSEQAVVTSWWAAGIIGNVRVRVSVRERFLS